MACNFIRIFSVLISASLLGVDAAHSFAQYPYESVAGPTPAVSSHLIAFESEALGPRIGAVRPGGEPNPASMATGRVYGVLLKLPRTTTSKKLMEVSVAPELDAIREQVEKRVRQSRVADAVFVGVAPQTEVYADEHQVLTILLSRDAVTRQAGIRKVHGGALEELEVILERLTSVPRWPIEKPSVMDDALGKSLTDLRRHYQEGARDVVLRRLTELSGFANEVYLQAIRSQQTRMQQLWKQTSDQWDPKKWADFLQSVIEPLNAYFFIHHGWYVHASPTDLSIAEVTSREFVRDSVRPYWRLEIANPIGDYLEQKAAFATSNLIVLNAANRDRILGVDNTHTDRRGFLDFVIMLEEETHLSDLRLSETLSQSIEPTSALFVHQLTSGILLLVNQPTPIREGIAAQLLRFLAEGAIPREDFSHHLLETHADYLKIIGAYSPAALKWIIDHILGHSSNYKISGQIILTEMAIRLARLFVSRGYSIEDPVEFLLNGNPQLLWNAIRKKPWVPSPPRIMDESA